jgi:adenine phosphoribosyltransferase
MTLEDEIKTAIVDVLDFPKPGIVYKDITPIFENPKLAQRILDTLYEVYKNQKIDAVTGLESRGFLFGMPLAVRLGVPFILIRKKKKLPREVYSVSYQLEYGESTVEMHTDAVKPGQRVLIHDDVLATGGTATAAAELITMAGGEIAGFSFLTELSFLQGRNALPVPSEQIITFATF